MTVNRGTHTVVENAASGFTTTYGNNLNANTNCNSLVITNGGTATCTITNTLIVTGGAIAHTSTTCAMYNTGLQPSDYLTTLFYSASGGTVGNNVNPGVFFFYTRVTVTGAPQNVTVVQTTDSNNPTELFAPQQSQANLYTSTCAGVNISGTASGGTVTYANVPAGDYIIGIKYDSKTFVGSPAPAPQVPTYTFKAYVNGVYVPNSVNGNGLFFQFQ
jgi:hypothetical protein